MHTTRILADYVFASRADNLPERTHEAALRCILDLLTVAVAGYRTPAAEGTRRVARELYGNGRAAIWFSGQAMTATGAVLCNSTAASALDLDDGNRAARGHPGAAVIPVALAVASEINASAEAVIAAIVAGYEVGVRVAAARNAANAISRQSGRWSGYAAVATAGLLRKTPPHQMSHAFAIAGVTAPNQEANGSSGYSRLTGNDVKEGIAWSSAGGLTALHLAEAGLTGPEDILDHASHFSRAHLLGGLGENPLIGATYFKPYSCCRYNHSAIDAFTALMADHSLPPNDIVAVDVHTFGWALKLGNKIEPQNLVDVQYSIPYCIGMAAIMGSAALLPIEADALNRPDVSEFARKVTLHTDAALDARFPDETLARVVITTHNATFESPVTTPRGEPSNPMSWEDLREKFRVATRKVMREEQQHMTLEAVDRLAQGELGPLVRILAIPLMK
ncbi:MAG: MmgE/PrpD family protein [Burkholderiales bacterium]